MKRLFLLASFAALTACQFQNLVSNVVGNGVPVETVIETDEFVSISSLCSLDIVYAQADGEQSVTLTCDENLVGYYQIKVEEGTLEVTTKPGTSISPKVTSFLTVTSPKFSGISVSGSGNCRITSPLSSRSDVSLLVSGSGSIRAEGQVECRNFTSTVTGSGDVVVSGVWSDIARLKLNGSGSLTVNELTAAVVTARVSGSGVANFACKDAGDIDLDMSGSGSVTLTGNAYSLSSRTSGSGQVYTKDLSLR